MDGWVNVRAGLRIAYSNQKLRFAYFRVRLEQMTLGILRALVLSMFGFGLKMFYFDGCCKNVVGAVIFLFGICKNAKCCCHKNWVFCHL